MKTNDIPLGKLCDYGCGKPAIHQFKNGKYCCSKSFLQCINIRKKNGDGQRNGPNNKKGKKRAPFSKEWRKNMKEAQEKLGPRGPRTPEVKEKIRKSKTGVKIGPMKEDQKIKIGISNKGKHKEPKSEETKQKLSIIQKRNWANPDSVFNSEEFLKKIGNNISKKPTKPEKILLNLLETLFPGEYEYTGNYKIWIKRKNPDFLNRKDKKIIEYFGGWWHDLEVTGKTLEENKVDRIDFFKNEGYLVLILDEDDLKNIEIVKDKLLKFEKEKSIE